MSTKVSAGLHANMIPLKIVSTLATRRAIEMVVANAETAQRHPAVAIIGAGSVLAKTLRDNSGDWFLGPEGLTQQLTAQGVLREGTTVNLLRSPTAMAWTGGPPPELADRRDVRTLLLSVRSVSYSMAESGRHFLRIADELGIGDAARSKAVLPAPGELVGEVLRTARAELGFQQLAELLEFDELHILALPTEFSSSITYQLTRFNGSRDDEAAATWLGHLRSPTLHATWQRLGLNPFC